MNVMGLDIFIAWALVLYASMLKSEGVFNGQLQVITPACEAIR